MSAVAANQPINQRKRTINQADDSIGKSEEVREDNVLIHSVSCDFGYADGGSGGLRRRKKQRHEEDDSHAADDEMTEAAAAAAAASVPSASQQKASPPSVVPLSMQLFRPFWTLSCCPDCDNDPMSNHHRRRMMQDDSFLMDGSGGSSSPPSAIDGGLLDARLRSVSMTSTKGIIGVSGSSASSTITSGIKLSLPPPSSDRDLHFKMEQERRNAPDVDEEDDISNRVAVASNNSSSFLPSSSSSLESTTKHAPSPLSSSTSGVLLDRSLRSDRLLIPSSLNTTTADASSSSTALANTDVTIEQLLHEYTTACTIFGCHNRINPGVLTTLRYQLPTLRVSGNFFDADMLALSEVLLRHCNGALKYITRLDFSIAAKEGKSSSFGGGSGDGKRGFRSHGAYSLAKVLGMSEYIEEVYLMGNRVGPFGASAIFASIGKNDRTVLKTLLMRGCRIGERGALSFVSEVLETKNNDDNSKNNSKKEIVLEEVDFSANRIGFHGCYEIERALKASSSAIRSTASALAASTSSSSSSSSSHISNNDAITTVWTPSGVKISATAHSLHVDLEANLVFQEVMNCITHGLGIILAIIGCILLSSSVADKPSHYINSCAIYSTSLIVLFSCSTLYHSFFALTRTRFIFRVFDRCAIYMLIGGSYSPLLNIALQKHEYTKLLWFIYTCGCCGIVTEATLWRWKHKPKFSLAMYFCCAWSAIVCLPDLVEALPIEAVWIFAAGGVVYTIGVPFFVRNNNLDHSIWHVFVLIGAVLHWLVVYLYVARLPVVD
mmetsp:Transcript_12845/g.21028  ORF Transcript_12845/g.21028 Transcript_12845/m.21028 type:complete len:777 (-) Transcript_12845:176-2506(-)